MATRFPSGLHLAGVMVSASWGRKRSAGTTVTHASSIAMTASRTWVVRGGGTSTTHTPYIHHTSTTHTHHTPHSRYIHQTRTLQPPHTPHIHPLNTPLTPQTHTCFLLSLRLANAGITRGRICCEKGAPIARARSPRVLHTCATRFLFESDRRPCVGGGVVGGIDRKEILR